MAISTTTQGAWETGEVECRRWVVDNSFCMSLTITTDQLCQHEEHFLLIELMQSHSQTSSYISMTSLDNAFLYGSLYLSAFAPMCQGPFFNPFVAVG